MERILIEVNGLQEAQAALDAVKALRAGALPPSAGSAGSELADRLYTVLTETPLPEGACILLEALAKAPASDWVTLDRLEEALVSAGYTETGNAWGKVRAGLAGLSWLINEKMPEEAKAKGALNLLVTRRLFEGRTRYRLTDPGRVAAQRMFQPQ